jgi:hypothetical protein
MGTFTGRTRHVTAAVTALLLAATGTVLAAAPADAAAAVPTVRVRISDNAITFIGGGASTENGVTTLHAGRYHFRVRSAGGSHALQLIRLRPGYTAQQLQQDFAGLDSGDVGAVQRIDNGVDFRGGVNAKENAPGHLVVKLGAGPLMAFDTNGDASASLQIVGKAHKQNQVDHSGSYTAFTYGWGVSKHLPATGVVKFAVQADQPHFLVLQRVKTSTTASQVRKFIDSGAQSNPSWVLKGSTDSGVLSPGRSQLFRYDLKPGKYIVACFWPDYFSGMPHFNMGMWKLVTLS